MHESWDPDDAPDDKLHAVKQGLTLPGLALAAAVGVIALLGFTSLPGLLLTLPLGALAFALMFALARRSGEGHWQRPSFRDIFEIEQIEYCLHMLPLALPFALALLGAAATGSMLLASVAWLAVVLILPGAIIASLVADSPGAGLNPAAIAHVFRTTRREYVTVGAAGAVTVVAFSVLTVTPEPARLPVQAGLAFVATLVAFALAARLGLVARMHRRMLDYHAGVAPIDRSRPPMPDVYEPAMLAADAEVLLSEKRNRDARLLLGRALTRFPDDARLNEQFDALVAATARPRELRNHLERRLQRLFDSGSAAAATAMWQRYSPQLDNWVPRVSETRYRLALELDEMGDHQTAFRLLIGLPPDDSRFRHTAEAWLEAARILEDELDEPGRAAELRKVVRRRYPEKARAWDRRWPGHGHSDSQTRDARAAQAAGG